MDASSNIKSKTIDKDTIYSDKIKFLRQIIDVSNISPGVSYVLYSFLQLLSQDRSVSKMDIMDIFTAYFEESFSQIFKSDKNSPDGQNMGMAYFYLSVQYLVYLKLISGVEIDFEKPDDININVVIKGTSDEALKIERKGFLFLDKLGRIRNMNLTSKQFEDEVKNILLQEIDDTLKELSKNSQDVPVKTTKSSKSAKVSKSSKTSKISKKAPVDKSIKQVLDDDFIVIADDKIQ